MSTHNKNFWLQRDAGCLTDAKMGLETSSKVEQKRAYQWDIPEREFFSNKKPAVDSIVTRPISGMENVNISLWDSASSCQSVSGFGDHQFGHEPIQAHDLAGKTISSASTGNLYMERNGAIAQLGNNSAINLAMTQVMEDPLCGAENTNVNQGSNFRNSFSVSMVQTKTSGENNKFTAGTSCPRSHSSIPLQPTFQKGNGNVISLGATFSKVDDNSISMSQSLNKGDIDFMLMGNHYDRENNGILSVAQPFNKWNSNFISMNQQYGKENSSFMSTGPANGEEQNNFIVGPTYDKGAGMSMDTTFDKRDAVITSAGPTHNKDEASVVSIGIMCGKQNSSIISMGHNYDQDETTTISFGLEANDLSVRLVSSSDLSTRKSSVKDSEALAANDVMEQNVDQVMNVALTSTNTDGAPKSKEQKKKIPTNNFPSNVKSMLSTGIFDGVPVKYVSWSREKNLHAVIKGTGYVCSCNDCNHSKALNAYEFERHAGGKTKHPNNHIYFESGKTVYAAVQELKSTAQEMLFEAIQNVTGSPINQKNFRIWKVSYQAATRELERIYGKDETIKPS